MCVESSGVGGSEELVRMGSELEVMASRRLSNGSFCAASAKAMVVVWEFFFFFFFFELHLESRPKLTSWMLRTAKVDINLPSSTNLLSDPLSQVAISSK